MLRIIDIFSARFAKSAFLHNKICQTTATSLKFIIAGTHFLLKKILKEVKDFFPNEIVKNAPLF